MADLTIDVNMVNWVAQLATPTRSSRSGSSSPRWSSEVMAELACSPVDKMQENEVESTLVMPRAITMLDSVRADAEECLPTMMVPAPSAPPLEEDGDAAEAEEDEEADEQLVHVHVFESAAPERQQEKKLSREERLVARERARDEVKHLLCMKLLLKRKAELAS